MKAFLAVLAIGLCLTQVSKAADAANPPAPAVEMFTKLVDAIGSGDYAAFKAPGSAAFQGSLTEDVFQRVSSQLGPVLKGGYDSTYLTSMTQGGYDVYLWKITPKTGNDQLVAKLVVDKDNKTAGFWIN